MDQQLQDALDKLRSKLEEDIFDSRKKIEELLEEANRDYKLEDWYYLLEDAAQIVRFSAQIEGLKKALSYVEILKTQY